MIDLVSTISDERLAEMIIAAYRRGHAWCLENPGSEEYLAKAAYDYADKALSSLEASPASVSEGPTHRHKKRGTEYVLIGIGKMQAENWGEAEIGYGIEGSYEYVSSIDMREVAIYRSATDPNEIWVRPLEEFNDGRFEALAAKGGQ